MTFHNIYQLNTLDNVCCLSINDKVLRPLIVKIANSIDSDQVAQDEPPYLGLHCVPSSL